MRLLIKCIYYTPLAITIVVRSSWKTPSFTWPASGANSTSLQRHTWEAVDDWFAWAWYQVKVLCQLSCCCQCVALSFTFHKMIQTVWTSISCYTKGCIQALHFHSFTLSCICLRREYQILIKKIFFIFSVF